MERRQPQFAGPDDDPDRYQLSTLIGGGGEGDVYRGVRELGDGGFVSVAVKIYQQARFGGGEPIATVMRRLEDQVARLRQFKNPGLAPVHETFRGSVMHPVGHAESDADKVPYFVMGFVEGDELSDWVATEPRLGRRLQVLQEAAAALDQVHRHKAVHGDIKPSNMRVETVTLPDGATVPVAVLVDFGLMKAVTNRPATRIGFSGIYTAPELLAGVGYSAGSDLWAFALTTAFAITGRADDSVEETVDSLRAYGLPPAKVDVIKAAVNPDWRRRQDALTRGIAGWLSELRTGVTSGQPGASRAEPTFKVPAGTPPPPVNPARLPPPPLSPPKSPPIARQPVASQSGVFPPPGPQFPPGGSHFPPAGPQFRSASPQFPPAGPQFPPPGSGVPPSPSSPPSGRRRRSPVIWLVAAAAVVVVLIAAAVLERPKGSGKSPTGTNGGQSTVVSLGSAGSSHGTAASTTLTPPPASAVNLANVRTRGQPAQTGDVSVNGSPLLNAIELDPSGQPSEADLVLGGQFESANLQAGVSDQACSGSAMLVSVFADDRPVGSQLLRQGTKVVPLPVASLADAGELEIVATSVGGCGMVGVAGTLNPAATTATTVPPANITPIADLVASNAAAPVTATVSVAGAPLLDAIKLAPSAQPAEADYALPKRASAVSFQFGITDDSCQGSTFELQVLAGSQVLLDKVVHQANSPSASGSLPVSGGQILKFVATNQSGCGSLGVAGAVSS